VRVLPCRPGAEFHLHPEDWYAETDSAAKGGSGNNFENQLYRGNSQVR
jgi:hypothetical protein